jgi:hypothetical protein
MLQDETKNEPKIAELVKVKVVSNVYFWVCAKKIVAYLSK